MKKNLLLLHGALASKHQFDALIEQLDPAFNVMTLDFSGHGSNASSMPFTMELFVGDVKTFLEENKIESVNIFGYSMGGYVALNLALDFPTSVEKIITLGTKFDWTEENAAKEAMMLNPDKIEEKVPHFATHLASVHSSNNWKDVVRKTAEMMVGLGSGGALKDSDLKDIQQPVLICVGSDDRMVSIIESEKSAKLLPKGKLKVLDNFRHEFERNDMGVLSEVISRYMINS